MTKITRGSAFLLCAILGVALLIGAVCNFAYSPYSEEPVEAATNSSSQSRLEYPTSDSYKWTQGYVYIYYSDVYIGSCSIAYKNFTASKSSSYVNYTWNGTLTLNLQGGVVWRSQPGSLACKYATSSSKASLSTARTEAYDTARGSSASSYTLSKQSNGSYDGSNISFRCNASTTEYMYSVLVVVIDSSAVTSSMVYSVSAKISGGTTNASVSISGSPTMTVTYTSKASGYFNVITIAGNPIDINASEPGTYTTITNYCNYKCWRSSNTQITVSLQNVARSFTVMGTVHNITPSVTGGSDSTATVATTTANGYPQWVYTYDAKTNYYINTLNVGGTAVNTIPESDPGDFTTNANCQFKCYRSNNQVIVIINALYNNTNIVGTYATLWSVASNKASLTISEGETTMTREHYFSDFPVQIVATFTNDQNFFMYLDGIKTTFKGSYCTGSVAISNGTVNYSYSKEGNSLTISLENMTVGPHSLQLDYELGLEYNVNASIQSPGQGTVDVYMDDDGLYNILVTPATGSYVHAMIFNDVSVVIDYYKAEVYGVAAAETVTYVAKDSTNVFLLKFDKIYGDTTVIFSLINSKPTYRIPPSSSGGSVGVSGTLVTAGLGGEARMVGFDYSATDNESIHFVAVAYSGYKFAGWSVEGQILEDYSSIADIPYDLVKDKVVTAVFEPKDTDSAHNGSLHDPNHGADIL